MTRRIEPRRSAEHRRPPTRLAGFLVASLLAASFLVSGLAGCVDDPQGTASVPLLVAGTTVDGPFPGAGDWTIALDTAELAFGPLYLCAGAQAGELCDTARAEWLDSAVVDALSPTPVEVGALGGVTGPVRSWMYDLGIASLLTRQDPLALDAAEELGGNSVRLIGTATRGDDAIPFTAELPIRQEEGNERGVSVVRKASNDPFDHEIVGSGEQLTVVFDARPWLSAVEFERFVQDASCAAGGPALVCAGTVEQTCAADGQVDGTRECADAGAVCVPDLGCVDRVRVAPDSQAQRAIRNQITAGQRPSFEFNTL